MPFLGFKTRRDREWEEVRSHAQADLVTLGEEIRALDLDIQMPNVAAEAKQRYEQAVEAYKRASEIFDAAKRPDDLGGVSEALEEGRYAMAYTTAVLEGKPPPERRPPCFFDPRHGPSVEEVQWRPPAGAPRSVPACAADALRVKEGFEPHSRSVTVGGRPTPLWGAPAYYGPYTGGFFQGFGGGLVSTLFAGAALGVGLGLGEELVSGMFDDDGGGYGDDGGGYGDDGGGDGGFGDGGGFGGGDFGGGDFGGGGDW